MKWLRTIILFDQGRVIDSSDWATVHESYVRAICSIDHPRGTGTLTLRRKQRRPNGQWSRNGVNYLRSRFLEHMIRDEGWRDEENVTLAPERRQPVLQLFPSRQEYREPVSSEFGGFDFFTTADGGTHIAIEWETGNISSSHRSMNKLAIALANEVIQVGVLIVPSRALYEHLTDRVGNIGELSGYLGMWEKLKAGVPRGLLAITVVEHDMLTDSQHLDYLAVGRDGRSAEGAAKG